MNCKHPASLENIGFAGCFLPFEYNLSTKFIFYCLKWFPERGIFLDESTITTLSPFRTKGSGTRPASDLSNAMSRIFMAQSSDNCSDALR